MSDDQTEVWNSISKNFSEEGAYNVELFLRTKSGEHKWFLCSGNVLLDEVGKSARSIVGTIVDIDEKKRLQNLLEQASTLSQKFPSHYRRYKIA